jgi:hypothetical protein
LIIRKSELSNELLNEIDIHNVKLKLGMEVYHARIIPQTGVCYVQTLTVRTIYNDSFIGLDIISKYAQLVSNKNIGLTCFTNRTDANKVIKEAQKSGKIRKFKETESEDN